MQGWRFFKFLYLNLHTLKFMIIQDKMRPNLEVLDDRKEVFAI